MLKLLLLIGVLLGASAAYVLTPLFRAAGRVEDPPNRAARGSARE